MSIQIRFVAGLALCWAGAATAQTAPAERTWTDPPARAATAPPVAQPAAPVAEASKPGVQPRTVARAPKTNMAKISLGKTRVASGATSARRRPVATVRTLTPTHPGVRSAPVRIVHADVPAYPRMRIASARPMSYGRPVSYAGPVSYGYLAPPPPPGGYGEDPRARRIRQAEAAGYLVVRRSTVSGPDGRLLYGYRPYEADAFDD